MIDFYKHEELPNTKSNIKRKITLHKSASNTKYPV